MPDPSPVPQEPKSGFRTSEGLNASLSNAVTQLVTAIIMILVMTGKIKPDDQGQLIAVITGGVLGAVWIVTNVIYQIKYSQQRTDLKTAMAGKDGGP